VSLLAIANIYLACAALFLECAHRAIELPQHD
jgi:hypothetical protein